MGAKGWISRISLAFSSFSFFLRFRPTVEDNHNWHKFQSRRKLFVVIVIRRIFHASPPTTTAVEATTAVVIFVIIVCLLR